MLSSVGGLNERLAQIAALQPPPRSQPGQDGGLSSSNTGTPTTDLPPISPIAGSTASPLSSDTNFLLTVFGGAAHPASRTPTSPPVGGPVQGQTFVPSQQPTQAQPPLPAATANPASDGITGSSLVQELQALVSPGATVTFASGAPPSASRSGRATGSDTIGNSDTAVPSWHNGWDSTPGSNGQRQQIGLAAYASADGLGQTSATAPVLQGVTA